MLDSEYEELKADVDKIVQLLYIQAKYVRQIFDLVDQPNLQGPERIRQIADDLKDLFK